MRAFLCCWLFGLVLVVAHHDGSSHEHKEHDGYEDHEYGGEFVLDPKENEPKALGVEFFTSRHKQEPVKVIAFNVERYGNWSEWSECLRSDCIEERHRECLDDSWKDPIPNRVLSTKCVSRFYVEKRSCTNESLCAAADIPEQCGIRPPLRSDYAAKIIGGRVSRPHSWPWAVRLSVKYRGESPVHLCGGTLIAPNWIITAAHCLVRCARNIPVGEMITLADYLTGSIYAHVGDHSLDTKEESQQDLRVTKAYIHPTYHKTLMTDGYDFALLYLPQTVEISPQVDSICLPTKDLTLEPGTKCYAVGWGNTKSHGQPTLDNLESLIESLFPLHQDFFSRPPMFSRPFSRYHMRRKWRPSRKPKKESVELREVEIPIISTEVCEKHYDKLSPDLHICAGAKGKDTCEGDSGGGLYCQLPKSERWYLAGITSFGIHRGCGRVPGVYTSVQAHLDWVQEILSKKIH